MVALASSNRNYKVGIYGRELGHVEEELQDFCNLGLLTINDPLEHTQYVEKLRRSLGLILLGNSSNCQIPGKLPHYIAALRPIFYFPNAISSAEDPVIKIMAKYNYENFYEIRSEADLRLALDKISLEPQSLDMTQDVFIDFSWKTVFSEAVLRMI